MTRNYKIWGEQHIDPKSFEQMDAAMSIAPAVAGALMPDALVGYGLPIGGALGLDNAVCPYAVGVDIACRMKVSIFEIPVGAFEWRPTGRLLQDGPTTLVSLVSIFRIGRPDSSCRIMVFSYNLYNVSRLQL